MKNKFLALGSSLALIAALGFGCATEPGPYTTQGTILGGVLGAATGAAIGSKNDNAGAGAVIGGVTGAVLGGVIGNDMDASRQKKAPPPPPPPSAPPVVVTSAPPPIVGPVTIEDVKAMSAQKVSDETIINHIRQTRTIFHMTASSIIELKGAGVSEKVINYMIETPTLFAPPPPPPTYTPPPPPRQRHYDPWRGW
jgi:hypothetical protein